MKTFTFNKDYEDLEQVARFYPEFVAICVELKAQAIYPTNARFEDKISGLAGDDEMTGIYLLQQLKTKKQREYKIKELLNNGYKEVIPEDGGMIKYESVVKVGNDNSEAGVNEYPKARIAFADKRMYIVPKGNKTRGYNVWLGSMVLVK